MIIDPELDKALTGLIQDQNKRSAENKILREAAVILMGRKQETDDRSSPNIWYDEVKMFRDATMYAQLSVEFFDTKPNQPPNIKP